MFPQVSDPGPSWPSCIDYSVTVCVILPTDIDECASDPCENGGTCVDKVNAYTCDCVKGFDGDTCQISKRYLSVCDVIRETRLVEVQNNRLCGASDQRLDFLSHISNCRKRLSRFLQELNAIYKCKHMGKAYL